MTPNPMAQTIVVETAPMLSIDCAILPPPVVVLPLFVVVVVTDVVVVVVVIPLTHVMTTAKIPPNAVMDIATFESAHVLLDFITVK